MTFLTKSTKIVSCNNCMAILQKRLAAHSDLTVEIILKLLQLLIHDLPLLSLWVVFSDIQ